jgi:hypothetical protein
MLPVRTEVLGQTVGMEATEVQAPQMETQDQYLEVREGVQVTAEGLEVTQEGTAQRGGVL